MKKIISLFILFSSCSNSNSISFHALYASFSDWSSKYTYNTPIFDINNNDINKRFIGKAGYHDMKRFLIELNQIDKRKLSDNMKYQYKSLDRYLKLNIIKTEKIKYDQWNLIGLLNQINELLNVILTNSNLIDKYTINDSDIYFIIDKINNVKDSIRYRYNEKYLLGHIEYSIAQLKKLAEEIKSIDYDLIPLLSNEIDAINEWYLTEYKKYPIFDNNIPIQDFQRFMSLKYENKIKPDSLIYLAEEKIKEYEKELVRYSLPIYLSKNDEPIWTDFEDSLNVINWVLDSLRNINFACENQEKYAAEIKSLFFSKIDNHSNYNISDLDIDALVSRNPIESYYNILDQVALGDMYQKHLIYSKKRISKGEILSSPNYLNGFKIFSIDYYTNQLINQYPYLTPCGTSNENFVYFMKMYFLIDRIKDAIESIGIIKAHINKENIENIFFEYDNYKLFNNSEKNEIVSKIYGLNSLGLSKFISYTNLKNIYLNRANTKKSMVNLLNLLNNNPNISFQQLKELY